MESTEGQESFLAQGQVKLAPAPSGLEMRGSLLMPVWFCHGSLQGTELLGNFDTCWRAVLTLSVLLMSFSQPTH